MKHFFFAIAVLLSSSVLAQPCTTSDGTGCVCENGDLECDLLPDLTISWYALENYASGPSEYSQSGNGANDGRLRITGSTPNIGYGSFTVRGTDYYVCGTDTIYDPTGTLTCPNGSDPTNLLNQRIYHRDSLGNITYVDIWAGAQTYHPTHGHNHVDDWVTFTLRIPDANEPDTLQWAVVGDGAKIGFCLMDFGSCNYYNGHCRDNQGYNSGAILTSTNIPNYGFGGGSYNCSPVEQGISVGFTDIYSENLDGMWIDIPPGTCNGDYWIVAEVDPRNNFLESDETNNWTAIPFTLTLQEDSGTTSITANGSTTICSGADLELIASPANSYLWSTGDTTQSIMVDSAGYFLVTTDGICGIATSDSLEVVSINTVDPVVTNNSNCGPASITLSASAIGNLHWFNNAITDTILHSGSTFTTPVLNQSKTYYVATENIINNSSVYSTPYNNLIGGGANYSGTQWLIFDVNEEVDLQSVKIYASGAGDRTLQILDRFGSQVHVGTFTIPNGESRITLNWSLPAGTDYTFRIIGTPNLFRNNNGVSYPYTDADDLIKIKNSSAGPNYYYFFYDWEVKAQDLYCWSERVMVDAVIHTEPTIANSIITNAICGQANGSIQLNVNGGTSPYNYLWDDGSTNQINTYLPPGNYSITVSDSNVCTDIKMFTINEIADMATTSGKKNVSCQGGSDGNASVNVIGGTPPYSYSWNTTPVQTTSTIQNLVHGFYTVTITDSNLCTKTITVEVRTPTAMNVFGIPTQPSPTGSNTGGIDLLVSGGVAPFTYLWSNGSTLEDIAGVPAGVYYCTVIDRNGCAELLVMTLVDAPSNLNQPTTTKNPGLSQIRVFPNPANGYINVDFQSDMTGWQSLQVFDALGKKVVDKEHYLSSQGRNSLTINLENLDAGIYFLEVVNENSKNNFKIIIE
ncbi:MAG: T9SS type A sorting domain-containing protein [Bacteroidia bacterium]|nr:T9SS type A sorting domain-containing protein [Bacteroidia bacterium]